MRTSFSATETVHIPPAILAGAGALLLAGASAALGQPLYVAGVAYMLAFCAVAWSRPDVALLLIFASAPFQSDLGGQDAVKFSVAEVSLLLSLLVFLLKNVVQKQRLGLGPLAIPVALYFGACMLSSALHWQGMQAITSLGQMFLYFVVTVLLFSHFTRRPAEVRRSLVALVVIGVLLGVLGPATSFGLLGMNKNGIGASLSCAILVCLELWIVAQKGRTKNWLGVALVLIAAGLLLSLSRGAWLGAMCGIALITVLRRQFILLLRAGLLLVPVLALCWFALPQEQRSYATDFNPNRTNLAARFQSVDLAKNYFEQSPVVGVGVGLRKQYDATNLVMSTLAETGVVGLLTFSLIYVSFFRMIWWTRKRVAQTEIQFSFLVVGAALTGCTLAHGMVDHYWSRGAITIAWASVGMAVGVYLSVRKQNRAVLTEGPRQ